MARRDDGDNPCTDQCEVRWCGLSIELTHRPGDRVLTVDISTVDLSRYMGEEYVGGDDVPRVRVMLNEAEISVPEDYLLPDDQETVEEEAARLTGAD